MTDQKRAVLAVILSGLVLFLWQTYFMPRPEVTASQELQAQNKDLAASGSDQSLAPHDPTLAQSNPSQYPTSKISDSFFVLESLSLKNSKVSFKFNNRLEFTSFLFNKSQQRSASKEISQNFKQSLLFSSDGSRNFKVLDFDVVEKNPRTISFQARGEDLQVKVELDENLEFLALSYESKDLYTLKIVQSFKETETQDEKPFFAFGMPEARNFFYYHKNSEFELCALGKELNESKELNWFGFDIQNILVLNYFEYPQQVKVKHETSAEKGYSVELLPSQSQTFKLFFTKKDYHYLKKLSDFNGNPKNNFQLIPDFGILTMIASPILAGLQFFYDLIPNYGIAIILLTLIVRLITFPLQYKSFKSMKKMQLIQPEIVKLRERFQSDPQRLQVETMKLFKESGANPVGGCLPLLLQMPIFFAFYKVLYSSVDLVGAPFFGWIVDLSKKDPYYVIPLLMALVMFLNQKLTPTTISDPAQKKVMLFMPVIFSLLMKDFPAGLTLYIFTSTAFGILQQLLVNKRIA